jgi:hypothetical protein
MKTDSLHVLPGRMTRCNTSKSAITTILSKGKKKRQSAFFNDTATDLTLFDEPLSRPTSKNSTRSNQSSSSDTLVDPKSVIINDNNSKRQLLKLDEDEVDRMQLKNDLVKLAFEG